MPVERFEQFYDGVQAAVRATLTRVSGEIWNLHTPPVSSTLPRSFDKPRRMLPYNPATPELQRLAKSLPPSQPGYVGMRLVDVARLDDFLLIAFHWRETGDTTYVYTVNLRSFAEGPYPVNVTEAIITMNLLERLGGNWYLHHPLIHIGGLTFMEEALSISSDTDGPADEIPT